MEMTIDETIIQATLLKDGVGKDTYKYKILTSLIDIAKKYQKIEQIAFPLQFCTTDKLNHEAIMKICEVLEDGNNTTNTGNNRT